MIRVYGYRTLPLWWVRDEHALKRFRGGGDSGTSIAALKVILGLCALCDMGSHAVSASYQNIHKVTGLSKPMISKGITKLEDHGIISVDRQGYINSYQLNMGDKGWAKVPCLKMHEHLPNIPNRGEAALAALKIYIYLLSVRNRDGRHASVAYKSIRAATSTQPKWIRPGLDVLINHLLIHVLKVEEINTAGQHLVNRYQLLGDLRVGQSHIR